MNRIISSLTLLIVVVFFSFTQANAALAISDTLSDSRLGEASNHSVRWTVSDGGGVAEGESFTLTFAADFDTSGIVVGDVDLLDDSADETLAASCAGAEKASFVNGGNDTLTFTICPGDGGAIATGSVVTVRIGANASGGINQTINPNSSGEYAMSLAGGGGYADTEVLSVYISDGISTTATVTAQAGSLHITGYASPLALVYFIEGVSTIATDSADSNSYFDETISGLSSGLHTINIYARDTDARNGTAVSVNINVSAGDSTNYGPLVLPPTFTLSSASVGRPAELIVSGKSVNNASVEARINGSGNDGTNFSVSTAADGSWSANINPLLHLGAKTVYFIAIDRNSVNSDATNTSDYSVNLSADLNNDGNVTDSDFNLLKEKWQSRDNVAADINDNGAVNITDLSIMMYYWTG